MPSAWSRSSWLALSLLLLPAVDAGAEETGARVEMKRRAMVLVPSRDSLAAVCPSEHRIEGCSVFADESLTTRCETDGAKWNLRAKARLEVTLYLWNPSRLGHEELHLRDVKVWLNEYVASLNGVHFASRDDCESWGARKAAAFPTLLNALKQKTNEKRDRVAYATARAPQ